MATSKKPTRSEGSSRPEPHTALNYAMLGFADSLDRDDIDPRELVHKAFLYAWQAGREYQLAEDAGRLEALVNLMRSETP